MLGLPNVEGINPREGTKNDKDIGGEQRFERALYMLE